MPQEILQIEKNQMKRSTNTFGTHHPNDPFKLKVSVTEESVKWSLQQQVVASTQKSPLVFGLIISKDYQYTPFENYLLACY